MLKQCPQRLVGLVSCATHDAVECNNHVPGIVPRQVSALNEESETDNVLVVDVLRQPNFRVKESAWATADGMYCGLEEGHECIRPFRNSNVSGLMEYVDGVGTDTDRRQHCQRIRRMGR